MSIFVMQGTVLVAAVDAMDELDFNLSTYFEPRHIFFATDSPTAWNDFFTQILCEVEKHPQGRTQRAPNKMSYIMFGHGPLRHLTPNVEQVASALAIVPTSAVVMIA